MQSAEVRHWNDFGSGVYSSGEQRSREPLEMFLVLAARSSDTFDLPAKSPNPEQQVTAWQPTLLPQAARQGKDRSSVFARICEGRSPLSCNPELWRLMHLNEIVSNFLWTKPTAAAR
jgi:hypothetical protein